MEIFLAEGFVIFTFVPLKMRHYLLATNAEEKGLSS